MEDVGGLKGRAREVMLNDEMVFIAILTWQAYDGWAHSKACEYGFCVARI